MDEKENWDIKPEYAGVYEAGQRIDLIVRTKGESETYRTQIHDVDDQYLSLATPTSKGQTIHFDIGSEVTVSSFLGGARYLAAEKLRKRETTPFDLLVIDRPVVVRRVQLRSSFRLDIEIPECTLHVIPSSDSTVRYEVDVSLSNLSAGGARMKLAKKVPSSEIAPSVRYILQFPLDMDDPLGDRRSDEEASKDEELEAPTVVSAACKIIDVVEEVKEDNVHYVGRCSFIDPAPQFQDLIIRFVNSGQMLLKRRRFV